MFSNLAVADGKLPAKVKAVSIYKRLIIQGTEQELALLVAVMDPHPHPFAGKARRVCCKFHLHVVAAIILGHVAPRKVV